MDMSHEWLAELETEDPGFMSYDDHMNILYDAIDNFNVDPFSSEDYTENTTFIDQSFLLQQPEISLPSYEEKSISNIKSSQTQAPLIATGLPSTKTFTISFGDLNSKDEILQFCDSLVYEAAGTTKVPIVFRNPIQAQDYVLSERKRREKLNRNFITLSSLLPQLKKMDKASILEDAYNYIKELQGRVTELEDSQDNKRKDVQESVISMKRSRLNPSDDEYHSSNETTNIGHMNTAASNTSPEIKVQISGSIVLVSIQCQKNISYLIKALTQMQKLGLSIIGSSAMSFANTTLFIIIVAQIEDDLCMTTTELVKNLQLVI